MANYKFDGRNLKQGSTTIANVSGNNIRKGSGSSVLCNVSGDKIRQGSGSSTIAKMSDVRRAIDGPGGVTLAALWFSCVR